MKIQVFFVFFAWIVCTCLLKICSKTKKNLFFLVFCLTSTKSSFKKQKTLSAYSFLKVTTKKTKNSRKIKKNKHEPQTKHSLKSFVFLVFWFSRDFFGFGFGSGVSDEFVFLFLVLAFGLGVSDESTATWEIFLKKNTFY